MESSDDSGMVRWNNGATPPPPAPPPGPIRGTNAMGADPPGSPEGLRAAAADDDNDDDDDDDDAAPARSNRGSS